MILVDRDCHACNDNGENVEWIPACAGMTGCIMKKDEYQPRTYRHWIEGKDLAPFTVTVKETDL